MISKIKIKICGINDKASMLMAISLNVNYIGLVFYKRLSKKFKHFRCKTIINKKLIKKLKLLLLW